MEDPPQRGHGIGHAPVPQGLYMIESFEHRRDNASLLEEPGYRLVLNYLSLNRGVPPESYVEPSLDSPAAPVEPGEAMARIAHLVEAEEGV